MHNKFYCTVGCPCTTSFTVQWAVRAEQVLLYSRLSVHNKFYCTVGCPCRTSFTVQRCGYARQVLLYSRLSVCEKFYCTVGCPCRTSFRELSHRLFSKLLRLRLRFIHVFVHKIAKSWYECIHRVQYNPIYAIRNCNSFRLRKKLV